jgi:hypothetical protein
MITVLFIARDCIAHSGYKFPTLLAVALYQTSRGPGILRLEADCLDLDSRGFTQFLLEDASLL